MAKAESRKRTPQPPFREHADNRTEHLDTVVLITTP